MPPYHSLPTATLLAQLERAGKVPDVPLLLAIFERQSEAEPLVLEMFRDSYDDDWPDDDPRWYRFVHAGRLLIAWGAEAALPTFADLYLDEELEDTIEWFQDDPFYFGPPAVPHFLRVLSTPTGQAWHFGRASAASILAKIARRHPETRATIVAAMRALLPTVDAIPYLSPNAIDETWLWIVSALADLQDEASRSQALSVIALDGMDSFILDREQYEAQMRGEIRDDDPLIYDLAGKYIDLAEREERALALEKQAAARLAQERPARSATKPAPQAKIGRNDSCPCGSGKKYKHCHGRPGQ